LLSLDFIFLLVIALISSLAYLFLVFLVILFEAFSFGLLFLLLGPPVRRSATRPLIGNVNFRLHSCGPNNRGPPSHPSAFPLAAFPNRPEEFPCHQYTYLDKFLPALIYFVMNTTISTADHGDWTPADITGMVNVELTFICLLINLHQSYNHKHYKSSCCGDTCFDVIVDTSLSESPVEKPKK
jgi:hypothetical protein